MTKEVTHMGFAGGGSGFALIVVLFVLLIIIGCACAFC
ncbi:YjcZ family sporulation protein [Fictibacillus sp. WQ 8-8]|nr:YjcZ family sporulation protein [Fictibacillus sp. WQ 8-8]